MTRPLTYILDDGHPVPCDDPFVFAMFFDRFDDRIVQQDVIRGTKVSTVFLGIDHNYSDQGPPVLWETMVFGGPYNNTCHRFASRTAALAFHNQILVDVRKASRPWYKKLFDYLFGENHA